MKFLWLKKGNWRRVNDGRERKKIVIVIHIGAREKIIKRKTAVDGVQRNEKDAKRQKEVVRFWNWCIDNFPFCPISIKRMNAFQCRKSYRLLVKITVMRSGAARRSPRRLCVIEKDIITECLYYTLWRWLPSSIKAFLLYFVEEFLFHSILSGCRQTARLHGIIGYWIHMTRRFFFFYSVLITFIALMSWYGHEQICNSHGNCSSPMRRHKKRFFPFLVFAMRKLYFSSGWLNVSLKWFSQFRLYD